MSDFKLTPKQNELNELLASPAKHIMAFGGARSGKTFCLCRAVTMRALKAKNSRHLITRFRFNACKQAILLDTLPKVFEKCWPGLPFKPNKTDYFVPLPNGSEIWIGGLDDKDRTEKILGTEFATIYFNECSQIPYAARNMALTRLAQNCGLALKAYYDANPPAQTHWTYQVFERKIDPDSRQAFASPEGFARLRINPEDNRDNLPPEYLRELQALPARLRKRFYEGEYTAADENALWSLETIDKSRILDGTNLPDMQRIVIAVDPSGSGDEDNAHNDEIGIVVAGLGTDGCAYILEDLSLRTGPASWGRIVGSAFDRHAADMVVGEANFGGEMVRHTIQTARPNTPYKPVTASRGKVVRAEPISALHETGKVKLVGHFPELEEELTGFTTAGYVGLRSPNRADAMVWAVSELFPSLTKPDHKKIDRTIGVPPVLYGPQGWMSG